MNPPAVSPAGLVGLAAILGSTSKDRLALQAARAALERAGITDPVDLALIGSEDVLPDDVLHEVLGDCRVEGVAVALRSMFQTARQGLDGNLTLLARRAVSAGAPCNTRAPVCEASRGSRAETRVLRSLAPGPPAKRPKQGVSTQWESLRDKEQSALDNAVQRCFDLLARLGSRSPRYQKVFNASEAQAEGMKKLQATTFVCNFKSKEGIDCARRRFEAYVAHMTGVGLDPFAPSEWDIAAYINDQANRGHSGPKKMLQALAWGEKAFDLNLCLTSSLVQAQRAAADTAVIRKAPKSAKMATVAMLEAMEAMVLSAPSSLLRCWAGVHAVLGHGVLRWADVQHSLDVTITKDAIFGTTWKMKGKRVQVPWAALRRGFLGKDWGKAWLDEMATCSLPGKDFMILAPDSCWDGFSGRIADFYDAQSTMRALLVRHGMDIKEAMEFSCHSWRHLYPTAGRQLDLTPDEIDSMGRWAPGTGMGTSYDSKACVSELLQKSKIAHAVGKGWSLVDPGCIPLTPTAMRTASSRPVQPSQPGTSTDVPPTAYVLQTNKRKLHGYKEGVYTLCKQWRCGSTAAPAEAALFISAEQVHLASYEICKSCVNKGCVIPTVEDSRRSASSGRSASASGSSSSSV